MGRSGAVYVFEEVGALWSMTQKIVPSDAVEHARFGVSLDLEASDLVIGAPQDFGVCAGDPFCEVGAAYMMRRGPGGWSEVAKLTPPDFMDEDHFGISVRMSAGTAVVGTESFSSIGEWVGSAYVFTSSGTDWTQQQKLLPADLQVADFFGAGLAIEGDRIVVGSPGDDTLAPEAGSFHVFERSGSVWSELFEAYSDVSEVSTNVGASICIRGDELFICAPKDFHAGPVLGSVQLFELFEDPVVYCTAKVMSAGVPSRDRLDGDAWNRRWDPVPGDRQPGGRGQEWAVVLWALRSDRGSAVRRNVVHAAPAAPHYDSELG